MINNFRAVFKFEGSKIICSAKGAEFEKFREQFSDNERAFGYIRMQTGDEMSKRQKFLFVTWVGPQVSVIQRAKMSTDKSMVKNVLSVSILLLFILNIQTTLLVINKYYFFIEFCGRTTTRIIGRLRIIALYGRIK